MIVGLTGGIGSGKTTVSSFFMELGISVYNSDVKAKALMVTSESLIKQIKDLLGEESYLERKLNKKHISEKIFNDASLLEKMNNIVHPAVRQDFLDWAKKQNSPYVIQETALIFENFAQDFYDTIILVTAPEYIRIRRVANRDGSAKENIEARIKNQLGDEQKVPLSEYIISNVNLEKTKKRVQEINNHILTKI